MTGVPGIGCNAFLPDHTLDLRIHLFGKVLFLRSPHGTPVVGMGNTEHHLHFRKSLPDPFRNPIPQITDIHSGKSQNVFPVGNHNRMDFQRIMDGFDVDLVIRGRTLHPDGGRYIRFIESGFQHLSHTFRLKIISSFQS